MKSRSAHIFFFSFSSPSLLLLQLGDAKTLKRGRTGALAVHRHGDADREKSIFHREAASARLTAVQRM